MFVLRNLRRATTAATTGGVSALAPGASNLTTNPAALNVTSVNTTNLSVLKYPYQVIDTEPLLASAVKTLEASSRFALDIEAYCTTNVSQKRLGTISLLQVCPDDEPVVYLIDVVNLGIPTVLKHVAPVMTNEKIQKLMFDCRRDVEAMSYQMKLKPAGLLDTQLFYTAIQWKSKSVNRRSGMSFVIKSMCGITRQEGDSAVQAAMTLGSRPVWDVRPLPPHFLEYAADDVRHILMLSKTLHSNYDKLIEPVSRLTSQYVDHYAVERPVEVEADPKPHEVSIDWLERFIGPGGKCAYCGTKGHVETECFKKQSNSMKCTFCGEAGHLSKNCYKKFPHLLKCELCGQMGHTGKQCFQRNKCSHCGGSHRSDSCHKVLKQQRYDEERRATDKALAEPTTVVVEAAKAPATEGQTEQVSSPQPNTPQ